MESSAHLQEFGPGKKLHGIFFLQLKGYDKNSTVKEQKLLEKKFTLSWKFGT